MTHFEGDNQSNFRIYQEKILRPIQIVKNK